MNTIAHRLNQLRMLLLLISSMPLLLLAESTLTNMEYVDHVKLVEYVNSYNGELPLFLYITRPDPEPSNRITNEVISNYKNKMQFVYSTVPFGSMRAFRAVEPLTTRYGFETLPVALILKQGKLVEKMDLISQRKDPTAYYKSHIDKALR